MPCADNANCFTWSDCTADDYKNPNVVCYKKKTCTKAVNGAVCLAESPCLPVCSRFAIKLQEADEGFYLGEVDGTGVRLFPCDNGTGCVVFKACDPAKNGQCYAKYQCKYDAAYPDNKCYTSTPCA